MCKFGHGVQFFKMIMEFFFFFFTCQSYFLFFCRIQSYFFFFKNPDPPLGIKWDAPYDYLMSGIMSYVVSYGYVMSGIMSYDCIYCIRNNELWLYFNVSRL